LSGQSELGQHDACTGGGGITASAGVVIAVPEIAHSDGYARGDPPATGHAPPALPPPLPPPLPKPASKNYFARHWRGELSLPKSYWLNGLVGGFAVGFTVGALVYAIDRHGDTQPLLWLVSLILTWVVVALFTIWQAVGVWRSATHYRQGGRKFWGAAAKVVTVLGLVNVAYNFLFFGMAQIAGIYDIVSGDSRVGPHRFRVLANGQMLEFSGGITFGVARELEEFLNAMGSLQTVRLNSIGGRILEAQKMSDMIRARGLSTDVTQDCLSACTIVFLGGKERLMAPSARLGFHQPAFRGMTAADRRAAIANEEARLLRFGLSKAFAQRANTATPDGMWYPDNDELLREKVVTRLAAPPAVRPSPSNQSAVNAAPAYPTPGAPLQTDRGTYETSRVRIPADLMKRSTTPPKKAVVLPPPAGTGPAVATGERK
jgi:ATP-dependent protease ClpP protease subunit